MQQIVEALDTAQALYIDAAKLYAAAWELFIDFPIPFVVVEPHKPCPLSDYQMTLHGHTWECENGHAHPDDTWERDYAFYHGFNLEDLE